MVRCIRCTQGNAHLATPHATEAHQIGISASRLCLAGASDRAVGTAGRGGRAIGLGAGNRGGDLEVLHVDQGLLAGVATGTADLNLLLVGGDVESDEEEQVRGDNGNTGKRGELLTSAAAHVGSPGEVGGGEVAVRSEVDEAYAQSLASEDSK